MTGGVLLMAAGGVCALMATDAVELASRDVRIRDIVELECLSTDVRADVGELVVASLPRSASEITLTRAGLAALARRRAPGLGEIDAGPSNELMHLRPPRAEAAPAGPCYSAARSIAADDLVAADALSVTACADEMAPAPVRYDRVHGVTRASSELEDGAYLGRIASPERAQADSGDELSLVASIGPIRIERKVWAVQPSLGGRVFVRDENGVVFSAPLHPEGAP